MPINKTNKGNRAELLARKLLKSQGYLVEKKNYSRWETNDFWKLFDVLALKPDGSEIRLIQVKSRKSNTYVAKKKIKEWIEENNVKNISCEVWLKEPRKDWIIESVDNKEDN